MPNAFDPYGNFETYTVSLVLENDEEANDRLIELAIQKDFQLTPKDIMDMVTLDPRARFSAWPRDQFISKRRVDWQMIANDFSSRAKEFPKDFTYKPNPWQDLTPEGVSQQSGEEQEISNSLESISPILKQLQYLEADAEAGTLPRTLVRLPPGKLPRKQYEAVDRIFKALGGTWLTVEGVHAFKDSPEEEIRKAIETGKFKKPYNLGYFPTQPEQVKRVLGGVSLWPGISILEPSIGQGHMADVILERCPEAIIFGYELNPDNFKIASAKHDCAMGNFLEQGPRPVYDAVIMNPPFENGQDVDHVLHAMGFVVPGGQLAAIMSSGVATRATKKHQEFRELLESLGGRIEANPEDAFKESGTMARTVTIYIPSMPVLEVKPESRAKMKF